eukprot:19377_1
MKMCILFIIRLIFSFFIQINGVNNLLSSKSALQLITQDDSGYLHVEEDVAHLLSQINGSIGVVSIVGPYKTGKSYLLNQLIDPTSTNIQPFGVGATVQPHSKGLSIFAYQNKNDIRLKIENEGFNKNDKFPDIILFIDTVGLFAPHNTEQSDARIVSLSTLISSILIFNHMNIVNSYEIERFNFIVQYSRAVPSNNGLNEDINWQQFQPHLLWIVRDFFLQLKNENNIPIDENQWLFDLLSRVDNGIKLYDLFNSINVFTMPKPTLENNNQLLQNLINNPQSRTKAFNMQIHKLRNYVFNNLEYKTFDGSKPINSKILVNLIHTCVRRLNSDTTLDSISSMQNLIDAINEELIAKSFEKYKNNFQNRVSKFKKHNSCTFSGNENELSCDILQYLPLTSKK